MENTMPKIARSLVQKYQYAPYYRYRYAHHAGKARWQTSFSAKHRTYQTLKIAYSIAATKLLLLIPTNHDPTSAINTRCPLWSAVDLQDGYLPPPPDQSLSHFSEKHEVPTPKCIGFTGYQYLLLTTFPERTIQINTTRNFHPRRK